ncbi:cysteine desulfurase family protein [Verrucomicrobiota bacterium sgz303538]
MLYFDHNATSPLCTAAREAWLDAAARFIGNPSSPHRLGARADRALQDAREQLAEMLHCKPHEIIWTAGATEANNTVIRHASLGDGDALVSAIEHPCVQEPARQYFGNRKRLIPVRPDGVIDLDWLHDELRRARPALVAVMAANNETGVLQPWEAILALCKEAGVPMLCDAAQWLGKAPVEGLGACDFVTGCAHKFGGPQGVGFIKASVQIRPHLLGGPQEEGQRAGTENVAGVLAMMAALKVRETALAAGESAAREKIRVEFEDELVRRLPGTTILGTDTERLWNTVAAIMPEIDCRQRWVVKLDKLGIAVSTGSACASGKERPSYVLSAMGITPERAGRVLRFSSGWETTPEDWRKLLGALEQAMAELR